MTIFTEEHRDELAELAGGLDEAERLIDKVPPFVHSNLDRLYDRWVKFEKILKKEARDDPALKKAVKSVDKLMDSFITTMARWKAAEASLYARK